MRKLDGLPLWIGTARDARDIKGVLDAGIEAIVDLAIEEPPVHTTRELIYIRSPLVDGEGNPPANMRIALEVLEKLLTQQVPTLVACGAGMSRSPAIVAIAIAQYEKREPEVVLEEFGRLGAMDVQPLLWQELKKFTTESQRTQSRK